MGVAKMEYLHDIADKLVTVDEEGIIYYDLFSLSELFYGNLNMAMDKVVFSKFPHNILDELTSIDEKSGFTAKDLNDCSCGYRIRFKTSSEKIILKIRIENTHLYKDNDRKLFNSFDIYSMKNDEYILLNSFAPDNNHKMFAECVCDVSNKDICIFLPNDVKIRELYLGIESDAFIKESSYLGTNRVPILFYGNSDTQGRNCIKSSNSYPNIISRQLDNDIISISCDKGSIPLETIGNYLGQFNCKSIILDCTDNNFLDEFEGFYDRIREYNKNRLIILLTTNDKNYIENNRIIEKTYEKALANNEPVEIICKELNENEEYDKLMYKLAEDITDRIKKF